jgi:hypothetical protein
MICSSVCLLRFIVWSSLKARLHFTLDQFNGGGKSRPRRFLHPLVAIDLFMSPSNGPIN